MSAIAVIEVAAELGLRVPEDLSVVGFDNIPESALCSPPLTTVNQPIRQMGERSIELLLSSCGATRSAPRTSRSPPTGGAAVHPRAVGTAGLTRPGAHLGRPVSIVVDNVL